MPAPWHFTDCCNTAAAKPADDGTCTGDCHTCWGGAWQGLYETCCLDQDPCRSVDCGHGSCVASGYNAYCYCQPGWVGADGKDAQWGQWDAVAEGWARLRG